MKPTRSARWGPMAWLSWLQGKPLAGDEGQKYEPDGCDVAELGPVALKGKGQEEMQASREKISRLNARAAGCPFAAW